ncbi:uncharacterized protein LOC132922308 [Rhopalosiphum padi]|uniref:uncharacterized protein LOC132922308 n=1 Tax=Rhopalosiphum padi TaxID=40932 RepID=UPI00298D7DD9|nr:uncharacterized protein LOC132922308 [Rhopalosiphum padi]
MSGTHEECEEYYRLRASEITGQLASWSRSAAVRDESFVKLLRTKIERRARLADAVDRTSRNAVAETRLALEANNERAAAASDRAAAELERFADELRRTCYDGGEATAVELDAENQRLSEIINLRRTALEKATATGKAAGDQLRQDQAVNDRMTRNLMTTALEPQEPAASQDSGSEALSACKGRSWRPISPGLTCQRHDSA